MAYRNLIDVACADKNEFFTRFRDFICKRNGTYDYSATGIGWTLFDSSYATDEDNCAINDWFVIYSPGESGDEDLYFEVTWISNFIKVEGYQSWDATAHTGANKFNPTNNYTVLDAGTKKLWIYGDLDFIFSMEDLLLINAYGIQFGKLLPEYDDVSQTVGTCNTTLTAGSDVSIVLDAVPANWAVDKQVFIRTTHNDVMGTVKIEKITIKTLVGNTITADLVNSYTTGSKLSDHVGYYCMNSNQPLNTGYMLIGPGGSLGAVFVAPTYYAPTAAAYDPDQYEGRFPLVTLHVTQTSVGGCGIMRVKRVAFVASVFAFGDVLVEDDGTQWRTFQSYSGRPGAVREV